MMRSLSAYRFMTMLIATSAVAFFSTTCVHAQAVFSPIYNFNRGNVEDGKSCSVEEWTAVQESMATAMELAEVRRRSRKLFVPSATGTVPQQQPQQHHQRKLRCAMCHGKPLCLLRVGMGCGKLARRRERRERRHLVESVIADVDEDVNFERQGHYHRSLHLEDCQVEIDAVDAALAKLSTNLTPSCQALLDVSTRELTCAQFTHHCDITGFTILRRGGGSLVSPLDVHSNVSSAAFCTNKTGAVAIRADADFFVGNVTFTLHGPTDVNASSNVSNTNNTTTTIHIEPTLPYSLFGKTTNAATGATKLVSKKLLPGEYRIEAVSQDDPTAGKRAVFTVKNC